MVLILLIGIVEKMMLSGFVYFVFYNVQKQFYIAQFHYKVVTQFDKAREMRLTGSSIEWNAPSWERGSVLPLHC